MSVTIKTRKFLRNALLARRQMVLDVHHPGKANVSRKDIASLLAKQYNVNNESTIFIFGGRTAFGGGKSTFFAFIYDNLEAALDSEPLYRLVRNELAVRPQTFGRKAQRDLKNKKLKVRGTKKALVGKAGKK